MIDYRKLLRTSDSDLKREFPEYLRSELRYLKKNIPISQVKILTLDIETAQMKVKIWQLGGNDYIEPTRILNDWFMVCWSAKSLNGKMYNDRLTPAEAKSGDDERIVRALWKLLNEQDYIIGHNLDNFDIKKANTRFLRYGLPIPNYYKTIDTFKIVKNHFRVSSNKLDYVCKFMGIGGKLNTGGIELWDKCEMGEAKDLKKMSKYCDNDVKITEKLFIKLIPYIKNFPLV